MVTLCLLYLDPASGSLALQAAIAGLLTAAAAVRIYWRKLRQLFSRFHGIAGNEPEARRPTVEP